MMMNNTNNAEIMDKIQELSEVTPESEYEAQTSAEDQKALEQARKNLMLVINTKCKGVNPCIIAGQIRPMVYKMNIADCEEMTKLVKKKGMYGLPLTFKSITKHMG